MALGDYLAGLGLAGYDPQIPPGAPRNVQPPAALRFDGASRDFRSTKTGFTNNHTPLTRKWTSFFAYRGGHCFRVERRKQTSDDFPRIEKRRGSSRARTFVRVWRLSWRPSRSRCRTSRSIKASRDDFCLP